MFPLAQLRAGDLVLCALLAGTERGCSERQKLRNELLGLSLLV